MEYKKIYNVPLNAARDDMIAIPVSSVCASKCSFCMNDHNPFKTSRVGHRPLVEIKEVIESFNISSNYVMLGGTVFGKSPIGNTVYSNRTDNYVSWGDALFHPQLFEILSMIRKKFPHACINFFTVGTNLTEQFIQKLSVFNPVMINLSMSSTNKEDWMNSYNMNEESYNRSIESIKLLQKYNIEIWPSIVPIISKYGKEGFEETIKFFSDNNIKSVYINSPAFTKKSPDSMKDLFEHDRYELGKFLYETFNKYHINMVWPEDPFKPLSFFKSPMIKKLLQLNQSNKKSYWFTSVAAYDRFCGLMKSIKHQYGITSQTEVIKVENRAYGGNIITAGLWMISDIRDKIDELGLEGENIVIPNSFIDEYGFDMMRENIQDYFKVSKNQITILNIHEKVS